MSDVLLHNRTKYVLSCAFRSPEELGRLVDIGYGNGADARASFLHLLGRAVDLFRSPRLLNANDQAAF